MINQIKKCRIVSFVGLAKNVGKTTALNYFLKQLPGTAVTTIGIDGEFEECSVEGIKKPRIFLQKGTLFTTTEESVVKSDISVAIKEKTSILTPFGHIVLAEAKMPGFYEIYGVGSLEEMRRIAERFFELGAERVFIDGAFFRLGHANVSSGCVLVSGSNVNADAEEVIRETKKVVEYFNLEKETALEKKSFPYLVEKGKVIKLDVNSVLNNEEGVIKKINKNTTHLYMPGAFTSATFENFKKLGFNFNDITIVIDDGTKCFLKMVEYKQLLKMGGKINVLNPINLCGIVVNSFSTFLKDFEPKDFLERMKSELQPLEVEDILLCS